MPPKNPITELRRLSKEDKLDDRSQTFLNFLDHRYFKNDPLLIEEQIKLWDLWNKGGTPFVRVPRKFGIGSYVPPDYNWNDFGTLVIHDYDLLNEFMAEIAHGIQFTRGKDDPIEKKSLRDKLEYEYGTEKGRFGRGTYGAHATIPILRKLFRKLEQHDIPFPKKFPVGGRLGGGGSTSGLVWEEFDPLTGKGVKGSAPTGEFEAHSIIEPSLWRQYRGIRKSIFRGN